MKRNVEDIDGAELDTLIESIIGRHTTNAETHSIMEAAGHYVATNPDRKRRDDPRYFMASVEAGVWVYGPSHMTAMKRAFVAAHHGMQVTVD